MNYEIIFKSSVRQTSILNVTFFFFFKNFLFVSNLGFFLLISFVK